jgi:signal transduction histidine kinase
MQYSVESDRLGQQIIHLILTSPDSQKMLSGIAYQLGQEIFQVDFCLILAGISSQDTLQIGYWHTQDFSELSPEVIAQFLSHPILHELALETQPLPIVDLQAMPGDSRAKRLEEILPIRSLLCLATQFQEVSNGIILLGHATPHEWTTREQDLLKMIAGPVAIASNQVQLQRQNQTGERYQTLLAAIGQTIGFDSDIESVLDLTLATTAQSFQVDRGLVLMLKYQDPLFKNRSSEDFPKAKVEVECQWVAQADLTPLCLQNFFQLEASPLCQTAWKNAPHPLVITTQTEHFTQDIPAVFPPEDLPALLIVPLTGNSGSEAQSSVVLGFLVLQQRQPRFWQPDEIAIAKWVGTQISTAIIHHRSLRQVQSLVEERTAKLKWSLDVQAKLSEKMRQQIEELEALNQHKDRFIANLSDELKHPLTKMKMVINNLLAIDPSIDQRQRYLGILNLECDKEISLVNNLLTLQQLKFKQFTTNPQKLHLQSIISELAQSFQQHWEDKGLTLSVDYPDGTPPTLYTDLDSLNRILMELLTNAGRFSVPNTTVYLSATQHMTAQNPHILIKVTDTGVGISQQEQTYIFEPFRSGENISQGSAQGTGLGLALVKSLVEHLKGTIEVCSYPSVEPETYTTTFSVSLPQFLSPSPSVLDTSKV